MIESIREAVIYMAHTHDGARVAMHCLWQGTAKVRAHKNTHTTTNGPLNSPFHFWSISVLDPTFCPSFNSCLLKTGHWTIVNGQKLTCFVVFLSARFFFFCGFSVSESDGNFPRFMYVCVVFSGFQDRKVIIKTMKTYMVKFATVSFI